jgi:hypothetical protein
VYVVSYGKMVLLYRVITNGVTVQGYYKWYYCTGLLQMVLLYRVITNGVTVQGYYK